MDIESTNIKVDAAKTVDKARIAAARHREDLRLRDACRDFEGLLTGIILKEGMKTTGLDDQPSQGSEIMMDFASEQAAREIGRTESFGIAKLMYQQMSKGLAHK